MLLRILPAVLLLISSHLQADEYPVEVIEYFDNTKIVAFLNESDIVNTSTWYPSTSAPPLTIANAMDAVQKHVVPKVDSEKVSLVNIELKPIPNHKNYWHYLVKTRTTNPGKLANQYYVVLMDGKVVPAIMEPESFK